MALTDVQGAAPAPEPATPAAGRVKSAAPAAAAIGIISAIAIGALLVGSPGANAPATSPPPADAPTAAIPPPGDPGMAGVQFNQPPATGPAAQRTVEIVVKFKDDGKVKDIIDAFWRDQASAKSRFDSWKTGRAEFAGLRLARVTYSNELVLVHDGSTPPAERAAALRAITAKLAASPDIAYAEQQSAMAQPGGQ
jgi:hypothetical protein